MPTNQSANQHEELVADFNREIWRSPDNNWCVVTLKNGEKASGNSEPGELIKGCSYRFIGDWKQTKYGPTFAWKTFIQHEPVSRDAVVLYLTKHCHGIGPTTAHRLVDEFGRENAISKLKHSPLECAEKIKLLNRHTAESASKTLKINEKHEHCKMQLMEIFDGYGFPHNLIPKLIETFSINAAERIRKDPWCLLRNRFPGCGFLRIDKLYLDLGHPPENIERQMFAAWHFMWINMASTWFTGGEIETYLRQKITGSVRLKDAIQEGVKRKLIRLEKHNGNTFVACEENARQEEIIADVLGGKMGSIDHPPGHAGLDGFVAPGETVVVASKPRKILGDLEI